MPDSGACHVQPRAPALLRRDHGRRELLEPASRGVLSTHLVSGGLGAVAECGLEAWVPCLSYRFSPPSRQGWRRHVPTPAAAHRTGPHQASPGGAGGTGGRAYGSPAPPAAQPLRAVWDLNVPHGPKGQPQLVIPAGGGAQRQLFYPDGPALDTRPYSC